MQVTVIGGTNADIIGVSGRAFKMKDSNMGRISFSGGGVGRNMAYNCALLGISTEFISAVGSDPEGKSLTGQLSGAGVNTDKILNSTDNFTDKYMAVINDLGEMVCAVNDMRCVSEITPAYLQAAGIAGDIVAADANLSEETLRCISSLRGKIKFLEPVSAGKATKAAGLVGRFDVIKPNILEAEVLAGMPIKREKDIISAGRLLISRGVRAVFITAGADGVYAFYGNSYLHKPAGKTEIVNATGAGDAFSAALLYSLANGLKFSDTVDFAMKCSELTLQSNTAVNAGLSAALIESCLKEDKE